LRTRDRFLWILLRRFWPKWQDALIIVKPETVIRWYREGFRRYWRWKSRYRHDGRPRVDAEVRSLIRRMADENPTYVKLALMLIRAEARVPCGGRRRYSFEER
jgi:hypothetical protein